MIRVTIYADTLADAERALRAIHQDAQIRPQGNAPQKRDGTLWSGVNDSWHALVWGGPEHYRADCRKVRTSEE